MGATNSNPFDEDSSTLQNYHFVHKVPELNITYLQHKENSKEYLLREMTYNDQKQFNMNLQKMNRRRGMKNDHLTNLERVEQKLQDRLCSNFYKIYSLWQYPQKNLNNEIMSRMHQKRKFEQKQLWSILASCIIGMSYLQQNEIIHESLTTKTILVDNLGFIKIVDPISVPLVTNFDAIYNNRALKNIYLSPQQCESIQSQRPIPKKNAYKNDVFTMGIILLQCGLLQSQQQCYRHQCQVINWKNLEQNIVRFQKQYNEDLKLMVELMLKRDIRSRLEWIQLEKYVIKDGKKPLHQSSQINHHQIQNNNINHNKLNYNHNFTLNKFYQQPIPNQNQNNNTITSPHTYNQAQVHQNKPNVINFNYKLPQSKIINYSANTSHQYTSQFYPSRNPIPKVQKNQFPSYFPQIQSNKPQTDHPSDNLSNIISNQNTSYINKQVIGGPPLQNVFQNQQNSLIYDKLKPPSQIINYNPYQVPDVYNQTTNKTTVQNNEHFYAQSISNDEIKPIPSKQIYPQALYQTQKTPFLSNYIKNAQSITYDNNLKGNTPSISMNYESKEKDSINTPIGTIKKLDNDTTDKNQLQYVIEHFKQGSRYEGSKLHGMRHGQGKFYYQDGGFYDGNWKQNKMDGYGSLYYQSGKIAYEGEWHNDQFQGLGRLYNENPYPFTLGSFDYTNFDLIDQYWQYYDGEFHQDLKQGQGKLMISNGEFFVGIFEKDMVEGAGKFYNNLGQITEGVWQSNQLLKL